MESRNVLDEVFSRGLHVLLVNENSIHKSYHQQRNTYQIAHLSPEVHFSMVLESQMHCHPRMPFSWHMCNHTDSEKWNILNILYRNSWRIKYLQVYLQMEVSTFTQANTCWSFLYAEKALLSRSLCLTYKWLHFCFFIPFYDFKASLCNATWK